MFQPDRIRDLVAKAETEGLLTQDQQVFFKRRHARVKFDSEVIVHNDRDVWMGHTLEASLGGSGLMIESAKLSPGQVVRIHFAPTDGLPAFNALGEIVGKSFTKNGRGPQAPVRYSVRFVKLDGSAEPQVREYFTAHDQAAATANPARP